MQKTPALYHTQAANRFFFKRFSELLNRSPAQAFDEGEIRALCRECAVDETRALHLLYAALFGLDGESEACRALVGDYFPHMLHLLDDAPYRQDVYLNTVRFPAKTRGTWEFRTQSYRPFELFVFDDPLVLSDGRILPQIGCFDSAFSYPAVLQSGREWMTVTPNEINTMRAPLQNAWGHAVTFGLGLGYFAFHASQKAEVSRLTVVERDRDVLRLFSEHLLPQFAHRDKITLVEADAFDYAANTLPHAAPDTVFVDLWHDASDGVELYRRMKALETRTPGAHFDYWIEKTLKLYLNAD